MDPFTCTILYSNIGSCCVFTLFYACECIKTHIAHCVWYPSNISSTLFSTEPRDYCSIFRMKILCIYGILLLCINSLYKTRIIFRAVWAPFTLSVNEKENGFSPIFSLFGRFGVALCCVALLLVLVFVRCSVLCTLIINVEPFFH